MVDLYRRFFYADDVSRKKWIGRGPSGFTMIEIIVVAALLAVAIAIAFRVVGSRGVAESTLTNRLQLQMEARKAADALTAHLREASEIIRPTLGQTLSYVSYLDAINRTCLIYPTHDAESSEKFKRTLFKILAFTRDSAAAGGGETRTLARSVHRAAFTILSPNSVQINITVAGEKEEYQFLTQAGLMNFGAGE